MNSKLQSEKPTPSSLPDQGQGRARTCRVETMAAAENLEQRVAIWVESRIGAEHMNPRERAMRLLEESLELAQAEGITSDQVIRQAEYVFSRPTGKVLQEGGGVAVCLLGWCAARGIPFRDLAVIEIERIEAKPVEQIRGSLARKSDRDLVVCVEKLATDTPDSPRSSDPTDDRGLGPSQMADLDAATGRKE